MEKFVCLDDFEQAALVKLPKAAADYYKSGATTEQTLAENKLAFTRLRIMPRCLRYITQRDLSLKVLGTPVQVPFGISPTAMQKMAHPDGEIATAKAAGNMGTIFILSINSTISIEDVAREAPDTTKWLQLHVYSNRDVTTSLIRRAENAAFKALVLTVDMPFFGVRRTDVRNKFILPSNLKLANFEELPTGMTTVASSKGTDSSGLKDYVKAFFDGSLTWDVIHWLKSVTSLPIVVKGVLRADDAITAVKCGVAGILVSNHGARQLDGTPATIEALPEIVDAVKGSSVEVFLDGGISQGTDILKALALGAKMVFFGRPALWGLACGGQEGVEKVLNILKLEFESAFAISGCSRLSDITKDLVVHHSKFSKL